MSERRKLYGPTERRILDILGDGEHHTKQELHECCSTKKLIDIGSSSVSSAIDVHICTLRKKLRTPLPDGSWVNIISVHTARRRTFQLVLMKSATIKDIKNLDT